jgi:antitoxin component YwqK of YwqJK toxin-antitoxin module
MSSFEQCEAITETGNRCSREAKIEHLCTQHYNIKKEEEQYLIPDLLKTIISDYIEYDELKELEGKIDNLKINPNRIRVEELYFSDYRKVTTYIDGLIKKQEDFDLEGNKLYEYHFNSVGNYEGKQYEWYKNRNLKRISNYKNSKLNGKDYFYGNNGYVEHEYDYKNGKLEGKQYEFYNDGSLFRQETYKRGKQIYGLTKKFKMGLKFKNEEE